MAVKRLQRSAQISEVQVTVNAPVLLAVLWSTAARAGPADTTARALLADWKDADRGMAAVQVIASAFASGMSWAGTIEGRPVYCPPPTGALTGNQIMNILASTAVRIGLPDLVEHPRSEGCLFGLLGHFRETGG
jgi:hypothetical protein